MVSTFASLRARCDLASVGMAKSMGGDIDMSDGSGTYEDAEDLTDWPLPTVPPMIDGSELAEDEVTGDARSKSGDDTSGVSDNNFGELL